MILRYQSNNKRPIKLCIPVITFAVLVSIARWVIQIQRAECHHPHDYVSIANDLNDRINPFRPFLPNESSDIQHRNRRQLSTNGKGKSKKKDQEVKYDKKKAKSAKQGGKGETESKVNPAPKASKKHHRVTYKDITSSKDEKHTKKTKQDEALSRKDIDKLTKPSVSSPVQQPSIINNPPAVAPQTVGTSTKSPVTAEPPSIEQPSVVSEPTVEPTTSGAIGTEPTKSPSNHPLNSCIDLYDSLKDAIYEVPKFAKVNSTSRLLQQELSAVDTDITLCPNANITIERTIDATGRTFRLLCSEESTRPCVVSGNGANRLFRTGAYSNVTFDSIQFRKGWAGFGGAIYIRGGTAYIKNCIFTSNYAIDAGGAIFIDSRAVVTIESSTFQKNKANIGGSVYSINTPSTTIGTTTFERNNANSTGGAVFVDRNSKVSISNSYFFSNSARVSGGGLTLVSKARVDLDDITTFSNNRARNGTSIQVYLGNVTKVPSDFNPYLYCSPQNAVFCDGIDSIAGTSNIKTNCLSSGIAIVDPTYDNCQ